MIEELNRIASGGLQPELTLLFDLPAAQGLARARRRNAIESLQQEERFERESLEFHNRIRKGYLQQAQREERFRIIEADGSEEEVAGRVITIVDTFLQQREST